MMSEENMRKQVMEEIIDFWINYIYGDPSGSLVTANNNEMNLRHLKRILRITELEKKLEASSASHTEKQIKIDEIRSKQIDDLNNKLNTECRLNWKDNQRIEKLEKQQEVNLSDTIDECDSINKELSELKEQIKNIETWINTFNMALENRIVLKKFLKMESEWHITEEEEAKYLRLIEELGGEKENVRKSAQGGSGINSKPPSIKEYMIKNMGHNPSEQDLPPNMKKDFERMKEVARQTVDWVKEEYEKGLKEGKWLEYPPKEVAETKIRVLKVDPKILNEADKYILVEKEDLIDVLNEDMTRREFREKYLEEDKE